MHDVNLYKNYFDTALNALQFKKEPIELYEPISYTLSLGGKRLRPILLLLTCEMCGGKKENAINQALGIELFHNFTLVHDDIMDQAPLRRNQATVYKKWNENIAILSGDVMFVESCKLVLRNAGVNSELVLNTFFDAAIEVCEGQQWDMNFEQLTNVTVDEYLKMIEMKTAALLGAALQIGALMANANNEVSNALNVFGRNIGVAFQIKDDILDCYGNADLVGKQTGGDILSDKKTFLLIKTLEKANEEDNSFLNKILHNSSTESKQKINTVLKLYDKYQVKADAEAQMLSYFNKAIDALEQVPYENKQKEILKAFAETLIERAF